MKPLAIITGAADGIGRETAWLLARKGYSIAAVGRTAASLDVLTAALRQEGHTADALRVDVADPAATHAALAPLPSAAVLVVNAGVCEQAAVGAFEADRVWRGVLGVNLDGAWHTVRAVLPAMSSGGRIIFVSSALGQAGRAEYTAYCASKHGLLGLMRALALEVAPRGITVNAVCPGWVDTRMAAADLAATAAKQGRAVGTLRAEVEAALPMGRFIGAAEVAGLVGYLASPGAAAITGQAWNT